MGAAGMRNAQPAAKESCLYDEVLTSISSARSYSAFSDQCWGAAVLRAKAESNGTPFEEFE